MRSEQRAAIKGAAMNLERAKKILENRLGKKYIAIDLINSSIEKLHPSTLLCSQII